MPRTTGFSVRFFPPKNKKVGHERCFFAGIKCLLGIGVSYFLKGYVPPLLNAKNQGIIDKNVVTVALIREGLRSPDLPGGTITYGDVDAKNCGAVMAHLPALEGDPAFVSLEGLTFGSVRAQPDAEVVWEASFYFGTT